MWIRNPGKSRAVSVLGTILVLTILTAVPALGKPKGQESSEPPAPAAVSTPEPEISFKGKVFCSLKRRVDLPFKGIITSILVRSGDRVEAGQVLARYRLAPESVISIRQRLSPPQLSDAQIRLTEMERSLVPLQNRQRELAQLVQKKLAPPQSLEQVKQDLQLLTQERAALQNRLRQDRQSLQDDLTVLKQQLGNGVRSGQIPPEAVLAAPIGGYVIWISPDLQIGAELPPSPGVFQVGAMDPMLVRAQAFEIEALQIKPGETAEITLESLPGRKFQGEVNRISWSSLTPGLEQPAYYDVELKVPNPELLLKDGLKAQIIFRNQK
ncbi:MAG: efflux RND transporter periplasmic adaptor subunit [Deltaproteobacteria bacterium]|nr:efflux RND transporter periplasmic adaptor subunit [Deltaproteobacteria bacterium]